MDGHSSRDRPPRVSPCPPSASSGWAFGGPGGRTRRRSAGGPLAPSDRGTSSSRPSEIPSAGRIRTSAHGSRATPCRWRQHSSFNRYVRRLGGRPGSRGHAGRQQPGSRRSDRSAAPDPSRMVSPDTGVFVGRVRARIFCGVDLSAPEPVSGSCSRRQAPAIRSPPVSEANPAGCSCHLRPSAPATRSRARRPSRAAGDPPVRDCSARRCRP